MTNITVALLIVLIIVIIIALTLVICRPGSFMYELLTVKPIRICSSIDNRCYKISQAYEGGYQTAADMLAKLNSDILAVIRYMRNKYLWNHQYATSMEPAIVLRKRILEHMLHRYNADVLIENVPWSATETSYTQEKGERVAICLREKNTGRHELEEYSDILFVGLHELAHVSTDVKDHEEPFWHVFRVILHEAEDAGVYQPVNYEQKPMSVCGLNVSYNPYYDTSLGEEYLYPMINIL